MVTKKIHLTYLKITVKFNKGFSIFLSLSPSFLNACIYRKMRAKQLRLDIIQIIDVATKIIFWKLKGNKIQHHTHFLLVKNMNIDELV
jgi:hypothetical protein